MFENICTLPLTSELFTQALHPTLPILSVGLSAGHVQSFKLPDPNESSSSSPDPSAADDNGIIEYDGIPRRSSLRRTSSASAASDNGFGVVETAWRTRRHKGSCRTLTYSPDGDVLFSAGTDGLVKAARSEDGRVISKIAMVSDENGAPDPPTHLHVLTPQHLILATDSSAVHIYDLRLPNASLSSKPAQTHYPHNSFLSSLTPLPPSETSTSGFPKQFVSTGGTSLAVTDLRRGVLVRSEDQDEELITSVFVPGLKKGGTSKGEKVIVGDASGVLTLWERGVWDDQDERIVLDRGGEGVESLTAIPANATRQHQGEQKLLAAGLGDGRIKFIRLGANKVLHEWDVKHDVEGIDGVITLDFDVGGRMVSGGGSMVKLWRENTNPFTTSAPLVNSKRNGYGDSDEEDSDEDAYGGGGGDSSDEDEPGNKDKKRKKRKRGMGKDRTGGQQVMAFKGLE